MGVILVDVGNENHDQMCNWWGWRPTIALIQQSGVIDEERLERMGYNGGGARVTSDEARRIADFIEQYILPRIQPDDRVTLEGQVTEQPAWKGRVSEAPEPALLYGAGRDWLTTFIEFCRSCAGFEVG